MLRGVIRERIRRLGFRLLANSSGLANRATSPEGFGRELVPLILNGCFWAESGHPGFNA
jgi:hypothetical protein